MGLIVHLGELVRTNIVREWYVLEMGLIIHLNELVWSFIVYYWTSSLNDSFNEWPNDTYQFMLLNDIYQYCLPSSPNN